MTASHKPRSVIGAFSILGVSLVAEIDFQKNVNKDLAESSNPSKEKVRYA
jgi:hypothetical protein